MPVAAQKSKKSSEEYWGPLSVQRVEGRPFWEKISHNALMTCGDVGALQKRFADVLLHARPEEENLPVVS